MNVLENYSEESEAAVEGSVDTNKPDNPLNEFATDTSLSDIDRIKKYVFGDIFLQKYTFIQQIQVLCENNNYNEIFDEIVPILSDLANDRESSIRSIVLQQFEYIANIVFKHDYEQGLSMVSTLMFPILDDSFSDISEEVVRSAFNAFKKVVSNIRREDQGTYTYTFILRFAQADSRERKITACKLIREVASIMGSEIIVQFGLSELLLLVADLRSQVRKHAILALGSVAAIVDASIVENTIFCAIQKNSKSSAWVIRRACAIVIPEIAAYLRSSKQYLNISRVIGELFRDDNPYVKQAILQGLGRVIAVCPEGFNINDDLKTKYYQMGSGMEELPNNMDVRCCAFYFPAVLKSLSSSNMSWNDVNDLYGRLCRHSDSIVRRSLAYSLHEVAAIIGTRNTEKYLISIQTSFLKDVDDVKEGVLKHLSDFWKVLSHDTRADQAMALLQLMPFFSDKSSWRTRRLVANQLPLISVLLDPAIVLECIAPIFISLLEDPFAVVRDAAVPGTCVVLNACITADNRRGLWILFKIINYATSAKYMQREMFIQCIPHFVSLLSRKSFKILIRPVIKKLATDPVPAVRELLIKTIVNEKEKRVRKLYAFKSVAFMMIEDKDEEISRFLQSHPLTARWWEDAKIQLNNGDGDSRLNSDSENDDKVQIIEEEEEEKEKANTAVNSVSYANEDHLNTLISDGKNESILSSEIAQSSEYENFELDMDGLP